MLLTLKHSHRTILLASLLISSAGIQAMGTLKKLFVATGALWTTGAITNKVYNEKFKNQFHQKRANQNHISPKHIQQQALEYAKVAIKPGILSWIKFQYAKIAGYLTVYDGAPTNDSNYNPQAHAFSHSYGGIFFPQSKFNQNSPATPQQRAYLLHEVIHVINGDLTDNKPDRETMYQKEFRTQKKCTELLYKLGDMEALNNSLINAEPYLSGSIAGLRKLTSLYPQDKNLENLAQFAQNLHHNQ